MASSFTYHSTIVFNNKTKAEAELASRCQLGETFLSFEKKKTVSFCKYIQGALIFFSTLLVCIKNDIFNHIISTFL